MPHQNRFRHQQYAAACTALRDWVQPTRPAEVGSDLFRRRMAEAGRGLARVGVGTIYLVHGTLAGTDLSGLIGELGRITPEWADQLRELQKNIVDSLVGDWGNYDDGFAETLASGINSELESPITVRRFHWSSENHHTGRADAAVHLLAELKSQFTTAKNDSPPKRVILWGHSHAGNIFALLTNLLGGSPADRQAFFRAARWLDLPRSDAAKSDQNAGAWPVVREWLGKSVGNPLREVPLDIVTFGTPVRYGWECQGYQHLLHFINHRPTTGVQPHRAPFPPSFEQIAAAESGDMFQQLFVAGTNFPPNLFAWRSWLSEQKFSRLLQSTARRRDLWERWKLGMRVPADGKTLLVDYAAGDEESAQELLGHAVYTRRKWLPFHLKMILSHMYHLEPFAK